jgi:hypothetical protein
MISKKIGKSILHFKKEINVILYIIGKKLIFNLIISFEQNVSKYEISKLMLV